MKKLFTLIAALVLSAVWVFAQDAAQAGSSTSTQATSSSSEMTIEGCLTGSAGNFTAPVLLINATGSHSHG